ncbi:hypothetical protein VDG1235_3494 [Verrucomicrobiia bacterium DG1235]|nr:hypothetical protein VDG1235_3494 [Verrucomicrobiae bacterium DG1235]
MKKVKDHPNISRKVTSFVLTFGVLAAISMGLFFYLGEKGYEELSNWMLIAFFVLVPTALLGAFIILNTVKCPDCGGSTKTIQNKQEDMWQAHCSRCNTTWNLGIGIDTGP